MNSSVNEKNRNLYNKHANSSTKDRKQILKERDQGLSAPLKKYHNSVKRLLINRFASDADRLLDLACGRGGDLNKWLDARIKYVKGYDAAECECDEARHRLEQLKESRKIPPHAFNAEFEATMELGQSVWAEDEPYDAVSCMFALHYFFASESSAKNMIKMVSTNLKEGGYFFGTLPDGKRVLQTLGPELSFNMIGLKLTPKWKGNPQPFGSAYTCAIADTVTQGHDEDDEGSFEYLVYQNVLVSIAAEYDLHPVTEYADWSLENALDPAVSSKDGSKLFRRFRPSFDAQHTSISSASALNCSFVFVKSSKSRDASTPSPQKSEQGLKRARPQEDDLEDGDSVPERLPPRSIMRQPKYKRSSKAKPNP